ncbi:6-bladed beta-propeller [Algoriphagus hitonicola]|uniref:6-bladed beta-propeller protein n=1 Tax=Algoriphagus hitonicola TaxID=435880 RepID=A0A1I2NGB3_9BACT|nr:6-bladed beta-propeller [Algoriphagus hitonicola]SFG02618.1 hypothetical protein SAMN04487988_10197 [Algoriphagus hitonicola]
MTLKNSGLYVSFILTLACNSPTEEDNSIDFPTFELHEGMVDKPENVLTSVEFIPLKFPEGTPVQYFGFDPYLAFAENKIFLNTDPYMNPTLHLFDYSGNHLQTIDRKGGGPNEYGNIDQFRITADDQLAVVSDFTLLEFDDKMDITRRINPNKDGTFYSISDLEALDAQTWFLALRGTEPDEDGFTQNFAIFDKDSITYEVLPLKSYPASGSGGDGAIAPYQDGYLLNFGFSDTLYQYVDGKVKALLALSYGDRRLPDEMRMKTEDQLDEELAGMISTQDYDLNLGDINVAGASISFHAFGIKPAPIPMSELEEMESLPDNLPIFEVFIHPEMQAIKATKIVKQMSGRSFSDGEYFYRLLYTEDWNGILEDQSLGDELGKKLEAASQQLNDEEDPILIRYQVKW